MELNGYRLLLPEGTLDYFDLVDVKESVNEVVFYLEEKNIVPEKYTDQDTESKGFYDPVIVQDFPLRGKKVFLNIRRRRWLSTAFLCSIFKSILFIISTPFFNLSSK